MRIFYSNTVGKKVVMAITGIILFGFIIGHMAGNLQFFLGPDKLDAYAENLRHVPALLWAVRIGLAGRRNSAHCIIGQLGAAPASTPVRSATCASRALGPLTPRERCTGAVRLCWHF